MSYRLPKGSRSGIPLPVTISVGHEQYTDARIYADGHVTLPATAGLDRATNECLSFSERSGLALFGWWADLDPVRDDGRVSTFQAGANRFVIEYYGVAMRAHPGGGNDERLTFQIELYDDWRVRFNYRETPSAGGTPDHATVGVQRKDGLFYNEIACVTPDIENGLLPSSYQSLLFRERDQF